MEPPISTPNFPCKNRPCLARLITLFLTLTLSIALTPSVAMEFNIVSPNKTHSPILGNAWTIFAFGIIEPDDAERLNALMKSMHIPEESHIYFDSPGGNVIGGIRLGKKLREWRLRSFIGKQISDSDRASGAICYSACTLAFLGGEFRSVSDDSRFGVHRFTGVAPTPYDMDTAQLTSAFIVEYLRSMGVDTALFDIASRTPSSQIEVVPQTRMLELNIINSNSQNTTWSIESMHDSIYLKGERNTVNGINKTLLVCIRKALLLHFIFDPKGRTDEVKKMKTISLLFDDDEYHLRAADIARVSVENGLINTTIVTNANILRRLKQANTIGIIYKWTAQTPFFLGFAGMPLDDITNKLAIIRNTCR